MAFPTNANQVQAFAGALYGVQIGSVTMAQVTSDIAAVGGLNNALNSYYAASFGSVATATVAASVAANLGLTGDALTAGTAYVTAQLNGAAAGARGAVIANILNLFAGLASDATFGAAATAWNTKVDAAAVYTGTTNVAIGSTVSNGSVFTLTTGVDTGASFTGTNNNDTFNAILGTGATLNSFDIASGGAGTDTLNLADSSTAAFAMPASATLSGFENVVLSRAGATGAADVTVTNTTFGTGVQSFSVVNAGANTTGPVAVTLAAAKSVSAVSTGTAFTTVTVTDTDAATTVTQGKTLETVTATKATGNLAINGNGVTTVNINAIGGTTTVTSAAGTRALALNASGTTTQGAVTDAQATSAVVTVSGAQTLGLVTVAKATEVTINTNAAATTSISAAVATKLNLGGTNLNTLTVNAATVAATSVAITGTGGVAADLTPITALTSVDTTGSTAAVPASGVLTGANTLTIGTGVAYVGGAGQDYVSVGATSKVVDLGAGDDKATVSVTALATGGKISGGDGTDELVLANADAVTLSTAGAAQTAFKTNVTGFETLNITAQTGSTVSVSGFGTFNTVKFTSAAAAQVLSGVATGLTIQSTFGAAGTSVTTNNLSGAADVITVKLSGDLSAAGRSFGTFATPGVETVNLVTADTNTTFAAKQAYVTLTDANAASIVVSGNNGLNLVHTGTALNTFNAGGLTKGAVSFTSAALTTDTVVTGSVTGGDYLNFAAATSKITVTETAGANTVVGSSTLVNTITGGSGVDTIYGGAAADVINGGAGNDLIFADAITAAGEIQTITYATANATAGATVTVGGVVIAIADDSAATATAALVLANAPSIIAANPSIQSIAVAGAVVTITYKTFTGDVAAIAATTTSAATTVTIAEGTKGIVPGATGTGTAHAAADVLTGGTGKDTFHFTAGGAITVAATITDLDLGTNLLAGQVDTINIDGATTSAGTAVVVVALSAAQQTNVTNSATLAAAVDTVLAVAGTVNNVAQFTYGADTYFIHNGATANAAFTAGEDTLVKITGVAGTLDVSDITIV